MALDYIGIEANTLLKVGYDNNKELDCIIIKVRATRTVYILPRSPKPSIKKR